MTGEQLGLHCKGDDPKSERMLAENLKCQRERIVKLVSDAVADFMPELQPDNIVLDIRLDITVTESGGDVKTTTRIKQ